MSAQPVRIVFGSQTGNAEAIAKQVSSEAETRNISARLLNMADAKDDPFEDWKVAVFIVSNTGDGDPPDTALRFMTGIKKRTNSPTMLAHISFCVLGLGDTNYSNFCKTGRVLDRRCEELGATRFLPRVDCDEACGLETYVEPWKVSLWPALEKVLSGAVTKSDTTPTATQQETTTQPEPATPTPTASTPTPTPPTAATQETYILSPTTTSTPVLMPPYFLEAPTHNTTTTTTTTAESSEPLLPFRLASTDWIQASVSTAHILTAPDAIKHVWAMTLDTSSSGLDAFTTYSPGDCVCIHCPNRDADVKRMLQLTGLGTHEHRALDISSLVAHLGSSNQKPSRHGVLAALMAMPAHTHTKAISLRHILTHMCDITSPPRKPLLLALAQHATDPAHVTRLQQLASDTAEHSKYVALLRPSLCDVLEEFDSARPPLHVLLEQLPVILPRRYSISSAPSVSPKHHVTFCFTVVELVTEPPASKVFRGLCTSYLQDTCLQLTCTNKTKTNDNGDDNNNATQSQVVRPQVTVCLQSSMSFRMPSSLSSPLIMAGFGTGVAPFVGFVEERAFKAKQQQQQQQQQQQPQEEALPHDTQSQPQSQLSPPQSSAADSITHNNNNNNNNNNSINNHDNNSGSGNQNGNTHTCSTITLTDNTNSENNNYNNIASSNNNSNDNNSSSNHKDHTTIAEGYGCVNGSVFVKRSDDAVDEFRNIGKSWLVFGCRDATKDFLFRDTWQSHVMNGSLSRLDVAASRQQQHKVYVQDILKDHAQEFCHLMLREGACLYMCGDGIVIASAFHETVVGMLQKGAHLTRDQALETVNDWVRQKRYVRDIWS